MCGHPSGTHRPPRLPDQVEHRLTKLCPAKSAAVIREGSPIIGQRRSESPDHARPDARRPGLSRPGGRGSTAAEPASDAPSWGTATRSLQAPTSPVRATNRRAHNHHLASCQQVHGGRLALSVPQATGEHGGQRPPRADLVVEGRRVPWLQTATIVGRRLPKPYRAVNGVEVNP